MRWFAYRKKEITENCWRIDAKYLARYGYFQRSQSGLLMWKNKEGQTKCSIDVSSTIEKYHNLYEYLTLKYSMENQSSKQSIDYDYNISLTTSKCNYGGIRYWLICPLCHSGIPCNRRVRKLYLPPGRRYFGCRHCYNLTYRSQQGHDKSIDPYIKNPGLIQQLLNSENINKRLLACRAGLALFGRKCPVTGA